MPVVQIARAESRAAYDAVARELDMAADRPEGLILHAASENSDGTVQIVDVYESQEQLQAFGRERLFPVFEALGLMDRIAAQGPPVPCEAFDLVA